MEDLDKQAAGASPEQAPEAPVENETPRAAEAAGEVPISAEEAVAAPSETAPDESAEGAPEAHVPGEEAVTAPPEPIADASAAPSQTIPDISAQDAPEGAGREALAENQAAHGEVRTAPEGPGSAEDASTGASSEALGENQTAPSGGDAAAETPLSAEELLAAPVPAVQHVSAEDGQFRAVLEAIVYVTEEPLTVAQIAAALQEPSERVQEQLDRLIADFERPEHGITVREVAGGYKMATKPEHHDAVRNFVKSLKPPLKLSLPALETLAVIAYKQPVTGPEIMEIRGVQGGGVLKTLLDRKLIAVAGRKNVIGKPMLYKTTKEFLVQFGLKDLAELPSLKEFEEIRRMAFSDDHAPAAPAQTPAAEGGSIAEGPEAPVESPAPEPGTEAPAAEAEPAAVTESDSPAESPDAPEEDRAPDVQPPVPLPNQE